MRIHGINDNILIPHPYYLGVYKYEGKMRGLHIDIYFGGVGTKQKK